MAEIKVLKSRLVVSSVRHLLFTETRKNIVQSKTKEQQLKGKIGSAFFTLFRTFPHFLRLFQIFSPRTFLKVRPF